MNSECMRCMQSDISGTLDPVTHLQTQEERWRSTFSTLNVRLH